MATTFHGQIYGVSNIAKPMSPMLVSYIHLYKTLYLRLQHCQQIWVVDANIVFH